MAASLFLTSCVTPTATASTLSGEGTSAQASTMHLEKTQGTVEIVDEAQKQVPTREGMQLYSGYALETIKQSFAWLSLDESKAIKLAEASSAQVTQNGKNLELVLEAGSLFFNVSKPLEADETLQIRTATMVTGIRGTSGWVYVIDEDTVQVILLEGSLIVEDINPVTGEIRLVTLEPGEILTIVNYGEEEMEQDEEDSIHDLMKDGTIITENIIEESFGLRIEKLIEENVPEWVAEEVDASEELQERITEEGILSVPRILGVEPENPKEDTGAAQAAAPAEEEESTEDTSENTTPAPLSFDFPTTYEVGYRFFDVPVNGGSGTGSIDCTVTGSVTDGVTVTGSNPYEIDLNYPGTYTLTFTKAADDQYPEESLTHTITVTKATPRVVVTSVNDVEVIDGTVTIPYSGEPVDMSRLLFDVYGTQIDANENVPLTWYPSDGLSPGSPIDVGTYTLTASLPETDYHYALEETTVLTLTIGKLSQVLNMTDFPDPIVVGATYSASYYYDNAGGDITYEVTAGDANNLTIHPSEETPTIYVTANAPGTYTITFTKPADDLYEAASTSKTFTATTEKPTPEVTVLSVSQENVYEVAVSGLTASVPYTGTAPTFTYTVSGVTPNEEDVHVEFTWYSSDASIDAPIDPGTYTLTARLEETDYHYALEETTVLTLTISDTATTSITEDATEPSTETPTEPSGETPTEPSGETPTEPSGETPTEPSGETPTEPSGETPTEPSGETPTEPSGETPTEPSGETPTEPSTETP